MFCLSSRIEGMPMVLLEAMNLNCACVSFDCNTGPSEMINDKITGLLVKDQDVVELANSLDEVISNSELRRTIQVNAPMSVEKYLTKNVICMWYHMFNELTYEKNN